MNKKGQSLAIGIMSMIFVIIVGMIILNFFLDEVTDTRTNLNCANPSSISDGTKLLCLAVGSTVPYWIVLVFSVGVGFITARLYT